MYLKKRRITQSIDATSALKMSYEASESCNTHQHEETQSKTSSKTDSLKLALQLAGTDVDTKSFGTRRVVASSLRNEKSPIVPLLLYWHPDADLATLSVHSKVVRKAEPAGLLNNLRHSLFGGSRNANNDRETCAFIKLLVQPERALSYISHKFREKLLTLARLAAVKNGHDLNRSWQEIDSAASANWPTPEQRDIIFVFHAARGNRTALELQDSTNVGWVDTNFCGDDSFLRLYVSLEFRAAHIEKLRIDRGMSAQPKSAKVTKSERNLPEKSTRSIVSQTGSHISNFGRDVVCNTLYNVGSAVHGVQSVTCSVRDAGNAIVSGATGTVCNGAQTLSQTVRRHCVTQPNNDALSADCDDFFEDSSKSL